MGKMASQITSLTIVYSTVYSGADQRKYQSSAGPVNSPHKWPVTRKMFPFHDVISLFWPGNNHEMIVFQQILSLNFMNNVIRILINTFWYLKGTLLCF